MRNREDTYQINQANYMEILSNILTWIYLYPKNAQTVFYKQLSKFIDLTCVDCMRELDILKHTLGITDRLMVKPIMHCHLI